MKSLSSVGGIKAETDLSSISRNGELGMKISSHMLDAKTSVLRDGAFLIHVMESMSGGIVGVSK